MKVIDLLNKIANGEELPKKFKIKEDYNKNRILTYNKEDKWFDDLDDSFYLKDNITFDELNDEIEIIEDKRIEKISLDDWVEFTTSGDINRIDYIFNKNSRTFVDKINEIIDKINGE